MKSMEITAVGIDVSKSKSTVAIRRPGGVIVARPFDISHSNHDLEKLVSILKTTGGDIRVVMEHTSNYWKPIALTLKEAGFYVSVVNAMLIHNFSDNSIRKLKTDRADSLKIANYALTFWNELPPFNDEDETRLVLREQSRMYERLASTATSLRNGLIALADQMFLRLIRLLDTQSRMRMVMKSGSISFQFIGTETVYSDFPLKNSQNLTANGVCGEIINFVRIQRTSCMLWHRMPFLLSRKTTEQRL